VKGAGMSGFEKTSIEILKGNCRDGVSITDSDGRHIAVFRAKKGKKFKNNEKDKVVAFDRYGEKHSKFVSREEGNQILEGITGHVAGQLQGTSFQKSLPAKQQHYLSAAPKLYGNKSGVCTQCGKVLRGNKNKTHCTECYNAYCS
jgi:hypothetical protein